MGTTRFPNKTKPNQTKPQKQQQNPVAFPHPNRGVLGSFPPPGCPGSARTVRVFPARRLHASQASFCVQRLLPATRTPGHTVATRNLSQYPRKFSKALQPRLHSRRHPTGKRHRRLRSFLHSVAFPALWVFFFFFLRAALIRGTSHQEPLRPPRHSARSRGRGRGPSRARLPGSAAPAAATRPLWPAPSRWSGAAVGLARPSRQGARWPAPPTPSARLDRVRHIGCRSRRGQRFLLCLRWALQVPAA